MASAVAAEETRRDIVLASVSPRRRTLVGQYLVPISFADPKGIEERPRSGETPDGYVRRVSVAKAKRVAGKRDGAIVVAADTVVVLDGRLLGKPAGPQEATEMLVRLRGRGHQVVSGLAVLDTATGLYLTAVRTTEVVMRRYSDDELAAYVASGGPLDNAGAYAVQDSSFRPAEQVLGCYLNVVGLPICELVELLEQVGVPRPLRPGWTAPPECDGCRLALKQEAAKP